LVLFCTAGFVTPAVSIILGGNVSKAGTIEILLLKKHLWEYISFSLSTRALKCYPFRASSVWMHLTKTSCILTHPNSSNNIWMGWRWCYRKSWGFLGINYTLSGNFPLNVLKAIQGMPKSTERGEFNSRLSCTSQAHMKLK
jgi:hypothetical protein